MTMRLAGTEITVKRPSSAALGYLAGIMDGEGYFATSDKTNTFGLRVAMTDKCVIDWLRENFSGSTSTGTTTSTGNLVFTWTLQRQADLRFVLSLILPLLVCKTAQAEAMLTLLDHLSNPPHTAYEKKTSQIPKSMRTARRAAREAWRERGRELRMAVRHARSRPTPAVS